MNSYNALFGLGVPYDPAKAARDAALIASGKEQPVLVYSDDAPSTPKLMGPPSSLAKKPSGGSGILDTFLTKFLAPAATVGAAYGVSKLTKDKQAKFQPQRQGTNWTPIILAGVGIVVVIGVIVVMSSRKES